MVGPIGIAIILLGGLAIVTAVLHAVHPRRGTFQTSLVIMATNLALGALATVLALRGAYSGAAQANPSEKATFLAMGISRAMSYSAFALAALVIWVPAFIIGELRRRRVTPGTSSSAPAPPGPRPID